MNFARIHMVRDLPHEQGRRGAQARWARLVIWRQWRPFTLREFLERVDRPARRRLRRHPSDDNSLVREARKPELVTREVADDKRVPLVLSVDLDPHLRQLVPDRLLPLLRRHLRHLAEEELAGGSRMDAASREPELLAQSILERTH